jgi:hypothetical protein
MKAVKPARPWRGYAGLVFIARLMTELATLGGLGYGLRGKIILASVSPSTES